MKRRALTSCKRRRPLRRRGGCTWANKADVANLNVAASWQGPEEGAQRKELRLRCHLPTEQARVAMLSPAGSTFTLHNSAAGYVTEAGSRRQEDRTPAGRRPAASTRSASKICRSTLATASAAVDGNGRLTTYTEVSRKAKPRKHHAGCQGRRQGSSHCLRATLAISASLRATAALASPCYGHPYLQRCGMSGCNAHLMRFSRKRC